ncbi:MAG: hypothetical protein AAGB93_00480 [Planctomycetota bacterium]
MTAQHDADPRVQWDSATIAAKLGKCTRTIHRWREQGLMPAPLPRPRNEDGEEYGPYEWDRVVVEDWFRRRGLKVG